MPVSSRRRSTVLSKLPGIALLVLAQALVGCGSPSEPSATVASLDGEWFGDIAEVYYVHPFLGGHGRVTLIQNGQDLSGTYKSDSHQGAVRGTMGATGTVTFTVTNPASDVFPVTFTGAVVFRAAAGADFDRLAGTASGPNFADKSWTMLRH